MKTYPQSHTFRGKRYRIRRVPRLAADGDIDDPYTQNKVLRIQMGLSALRELEVALHESFHACFWLLDETVITQSSEDIARFLWRLGYRRED